jgi:hypothetical protein
MLLAAFVTAPGSVIILYAHFHCAQTQITERARTSLSARAAAETMRVVNFASKFPPTD